MNDPSNYEDSLGQKRYLLTEEEFWKNFDLCASLQLAVEKVILNAQLPRVATWTHPAIHGYEKAVRDELQRPSPLPDLSEFYADLEPKGHYSKSE